MFNVHCEMVSLDKHKLRCTVLVAMERAHHRDVDEVMMIKMNSHQAAMLATGYGDESKSRDRGQYERVVRPKG